jgi:hypothetical protein
MADWNPGAAVLYVTRRGCQIGPVRAEPSTVHRIAQACVHLGGGTATVLERHGARLEPVRTYGATR